jgi:glycosyltransferase involved in cell wall biosynthesis
MKIAMIGQKGIPAIYGGIENHVEELSAELAKLGHDVLVYARKWYTSENIQNYKGIRLIHTPSIRTKHLDAITHTFFSCIHALWQKPDVIHFHGVGPSLLAWIPRLLSPKTKVVATMHCLDRYHQKWGFAARALLHLGEWAGCKFSHQTISVSKTIQNYCLNEYRRLTSYVPNGVQPARHWGASMIDKWDLQPGKYVAMISRLVRHKGAHYLIEAWQIARQRHPGLFKDLKLVIVGGASFTDDYVAYLNKIAMNESNIVFTGWQNGQALSELYANTKLLVHPSENEGLPITVLQAMSYGRPVLVSDIPEHKEVVTDNRFWFANASIFSLAEKIIYLLENENLLNESGEKNKKNVEQNYCWTDIAAKTSELYASTADEVIPDYKTA